MNDLERAKTLLEEGKYTLVLVKGEKVITSYERGVKPLLGLLDEGKDVRGFTAADRIVGKAAAFLYVLLGVKAVYANVLSILAEGVLLGHGIAVEGQPRTERIINRAGDGFCPMETAVENITDPMQAYRAIKAKLNEMKIDAKREKK